MQSMYLGCYITDPGYKEIMAPCYLLSCAPARVSLALLHMYAWIEYSTIMEVEGR